MLSNAISEELALKSGAVYLLGHAFSSFQLASTVLFASSYNSIVTSFSLSASFKEPSEIDNETIAKLKEKRNEYAEKMQELEEKRLEFEKLELEKMELEGMGFSKDELDELLNTQKMLEEQLAAGEAVKNSFIEEFNMQ